MPSPNTPPAESPAAPPRRRRWPWVIGVIGLLLLVLYAATPLLITTLAPRLAGPLGVDALGLRITHPGTSGVTLHEMRLVTGRTTVTVERGEVTYGLAGLLDGRLDAVLLEQVRIEVGAVNGAAPETPGDTMPTDPPLPAELFALLPADNLEIRELTLTVPALDFVATGRLNVTPAELRLELHGHTPAEADPFQLDAHLTRTGHLELQLQDRQQPGAPLLSLSSTLNPNSLDVNGEFDLQGFAFDLAAALAGAPAGTGAVGGQVNGTLPWPLTADLDPAAIRAGGTLQAHWRPAPGSAGDTDWEITESEAAWKLEEGDFSGTVAGRVRYAGQDVQLSAVVERFMASGTEGQGNITAADAAESEFLILSWALTPSTLTLDGTFDITASLLESARSLVDLPAGEGTLSGTFETLVPRPLTTEFDPLALDAQGALQGTWQGESGGVDLPEFAGTWQWHQRSLSGDLDARVGYADLQTNLGLALEGLDLAEGAIDAAGTLRLGTTGSVPFRVRRHPDGSATLSAQAELEIQDPLAGHLLAGWNQPYDLTAGTVGLNAEVQWTDAGIPNGAITADLKNVSAYYDEYLANGVSGDLEFTADDGVWSLAPASLSAAAVSTGVDLTDLRSTVAWRGDTVSVSNTTAELLGGRAQAASFDYRLADGSADILVELEALALPQVLALAGESVSGTGTLDGTVPVELRNNEPSVTEGRVQARPPGGRIQVSPSLVDAVGQPGLDFALRALQQFSYSALETDVAYSADGDLELAVRLRGSNPDIEDGRPIHYNLNINQNLPTLLRSLRLQDDVTRGIDSRLQN